MEEPCLADVKQLHDSWLGQLDESRNNLSENRIAQ